MVHGQSRRGERHLGMFLDIFHLVTGILVVVMGLMAFLNPERYQILFPAVFFLAAALNGVSGMFELKVRSRAKKRKGGGIFHMALAAGLALVGILSAVSIWG